MIEAPQIATWYCPRCPWFRSTSKLERHRNVIVNHRVYGPITAHELYVMDVLNHNCYDTRDARIKFGIDPDLRNHPYRQRTRSDRQEHLSD